MLLYCPKCKTGYAVEPELIPENGKKMRCARCGEIWFCTRDDLVEPQPEPPVNKAEGTDVPAETEVSAVPAEGSPAEPEDETASEPAPETAVMNDIFARLSTQTQDLFRQEQTRPAASRLFSRLKHMLGLDHPGTLKYYLLLLLFLAALGLFAARFEIVRAFPRAEAFYAALGIDAKIVGEGLEFQNVVRREYEEDYVRKLEIKGYIANTNPFEVEMPLIRVEVLDKNTNLLQALNDKTPLAVLEAEGRMAFRIVLNRPSPLAKYVVLTFVKKQPAD